MAEIRVSTLLMESAEQINTSIGTMVYEKTSISSIRITEMENFTKTPGYPKPTIKFY